MCGFPFPFVHALLNLCKVNCCHLGVPVLSAGNKKWKNSLPSFSGFITRFKRNAARSSATPATPALIPRPAINEEEDEYHGYLFKKSSKMPNLWKKKYCVLRQCIFAYYE